MKNKVLYVAIVVVVLITFSLMYEKQDVFNRAIVVGIAIDCNDQEVKVSVEYLKKDKYQYYTGKGKDVETALNNIENELGMVASLSQAEVIIFKKTQNICKYFNELIEKNIVVFNVLLIAADNAEVILCEESNTEESNSERIKKMSQKNSKQVLLKDYLLAKNVSREIFVPTIINKNNVLKFDTEYKLYINDISV